MITFKNIVVLMTMLGHRKYQCLFCRENQGEAICPHECPLIKVPSHVYGNTLDWIISPNNENDFIRETRVSDKAMSDHHLLLCDINTEKLTQCKKTVVSRN